MSAAYPGVRDCLLGTRERLKSPTGTIVLLLAVPLNWSFHLVGSQVFSSGASSRTRATVKFVISVNKFVRYKLQNARIIFMILHFAISPFFTPYVLYTV